MGALDESGKIRTMPQAFYEIFAEELRKEREEGFKIGFEIGLAEVRKECCERLIKDGSPEERARAIVYG